MALVLDASLLIALAIEEPRTAAVEAQMLNWIKDDEQFHAPTLIHFEVASGLTRLVATRRLPQDGVAQAWRLIAALPLQFHVLEAVPEVVSMALRLNRHSAYDAAYLYLAQLLNAELWTLDGPLARNAESLGFSIQLIS